MRLTLAELDAQAEKTGGAGAAASLPRSPDSEVWQLRVDFGQITLIAAVATNRAPEHLADGTHRRHARPALLVALRLAPARSMPTLMLESLRVSRRRGFRPGQCRDVRLSAP